MGHVITLVAQQDTADREAAYRARVERRALRAATAAHAMSAGPIARPETAPVQAEAPQELRPVPTSRAYRPTPGIQETPALCGYTLSGRPIYNLASPSFSHRTGGVERRHTPATGEGFSEMPNRDKRGWEAGDWATVRGGLLPPDETGKRATVASMSESVAWLGAARDAAGS